MYSFLYLEPVVSCLVLTVASSPTYRSLRKKVRWSGIPISWWIFNSIFVIHKIKAFSVVNKAEVDIFLQLSCFFYNPMDVGNLISGSSAFSKSSLNICKFSVHILLKPSLENFEHYLASMWEECNCAVAWTFFGIVFFGIGMKTDLFQSCGYCWVSKFARVLEFYISTNSGILQPHNPKQPSIHLSLPAIPNSGHVLSCAWMLWNLAKSISP